MKTKKFQVGLALLGSLLAGSQLCAQAYSPTLAQMLGVTEVTRNWIPGATSVLHRYYEEDGGVTYDVTWDAAGEGFSRLVVQRTSFQTEYRPDGLGLDLTPYDRLEFEVEAVEGDVSIKPFLQTGTTYAFSEPVWDPILVPAGTTAVISVDFADLTGTPVLDDTRQFGFQAFGPAAGEGVFRVAPINRVSITETPIYSWEDDLQGWQPNNWTAPTALYELVSDRGVTDGSESLMFIKDVPGFAWVGEVTITPDSDPEVYEALTNAIANGGALKYDVVGEFDEGTAFPGWNLLHWYIWDDQGEHPLQAGVPGLSPTGAQGTHLLDFSYFDSPTTGPLLSDSSSYAIRFATNGPDTDFASVALWLDNMSVVEYTPVVSIPGDYNGDGEVNAADVDRQAQAMASPTPDLATFDENDDGVVDDTDRLIWVHDHAGTWVGDADLSGEFNSSDLVVALAAGTYEVDVTAGWESGDFDGNHRFDTSDLVAALADGGYEQGPRPSVAAVPEPAACVLLILGILSAEFRRPRSGRNSSPRSNG
jgi:hypothetical protein